MERLSASAVGALGDSPRQASVAIERRQHPRIEQPSVRTGLAHTLRTLRTSAPLVVSDLVALFAALTLIRAVGGTVEPGILSPIPQWLVLLGVGLVAANASNGLYPGVGLRGTAELRQSATAVFLVFGIVALAELLSEGVVQTLTLVSVGGATAVAVPALRAVTRRLCARFSWWRHPMLVVGNGPRVREVENYFRSRPRMGLTPIALDIGRDEAFQPLMIASAARRHGALCAALTLDGNGLDGNGNGATDQRRFLVRYCASLFPSLWVIPPGEPLSTSGIQAIEVGEMVELQGGTALLRPIPQVAKRAMDLGLGIVFGVLSIPLFVIVGAAVKLTSPGPVFYGQERVGRRRQPFRVWKFRTMHIRADEMLEKHLMADPALREEWASKQKLRPDPRITPLGRFLRSASLDELPQLWNVIRGDMSLVGPRPIVTGEIRRYGEDFGLYISVKPGLTGLWQVSGRNQTTYAARIGYDTYYVRNWSLWLDLYILVQTVRAVITREGAS